MFSYLVIPVSVVSSYSCYNFEFMKKLISTVTWILDIEYKT